MKLAIVTTQTLHHAHFVREIAKHFGISRVYVETAALQARFETAHPFEALRDDYERQIWFANSKYDLTYLAPAETVSSMNNPEAVASLARLSPDVVFVFGAGRLSASTVKALPRHSLNLHGGDPEQYRGLDSHLWAIYHSDFAGLSTTLHHLDADLDAGDIVLQTDVPLFRGMELHQLRRANTDVCIQLALTALSSISTFGELPCRRQRQPGRYYSFMPTALKEICRGRFSKFALGLSESRVSA